MEQSQSAAEVLDELRARDPDQKWQTFYWSAKQQTTVSVGDLVSQADDVARTLAHWGEGGRVTLGLLLDNHPRIPAVLLGAMAAGCRIVPMNPGGSPPDLTYIVESTGITHVVVDGRSAGRERDIGFTGTAVDIDGLSTASGQEPPVSLPDPPPDEPSVILHTSGTTSKPKGVLLTTRAILQNARLMADRLGLRRKSQLTTLPMYHVHALTFGVFSSILTGGRLVVLRSFDPILWSKVMRSEAIQWTSVVPSLLPLVAATGVTRKLCPDLEGILVSSAAINETAARRFEEKSSIPVLQAWGQTEFTCWATCCDAGMSGGEYDGALRSVGSTLPGVSVDVVTDDGRDADPGEVGELLLSGPYVSGGYWNAPELSAATMTARGVRTGDLGYFKWIRDRKYYFICGRRKEIINRSGEKISPAAVEEEIFRRHPAASGYLAVVGFAHDILGEEIGVCIDGALFDQGAEDEAAFFSHLRSMHHAIRPRVAVVGAREISTTFTGKVQRSRMSNRFAAERTFLGDFKVVDERSAAASLASATDVTRGPRLDGGGR